MDRLHNGFTQQLARRCARANALRRIRPRVFLDGSNRTQFLISTRRPTSSTQSKGNKAIGSSGSDASDMRYQPI
jgi:uracil-DNA glycosylase